jgi:uncharacterized protein (DUF1330 family)
MSAYLIVDTLLDHPERYEAYKVKAKILVEQFGGKYLARGGDMLVKESELWEPSRMVIVRFPDMDAATRFYHSPEYQAVLAISKESARRTLIMVEGVQ